MRRAPSRRRSLAIAVLATLATAPAHSQPLDMTQGGAVEVTSTDGIEWRQAEQVVVARGSARAVRDGVTLEADRLIARYRTRAGAPRPAAPGTVQSGGDAPMSGGEIWRLEAEGRVVISTETDQAQGDRGVFDMDQAVMVLTGRDLKLTTPENVITARDGLEYWAKRRMAVARGAASVTGTENRRLLGDTLVAYFREQAATPQPVAARPQSGRGSAPASPRPVPGEGSKLDRVEIFGNVEIRTQGEVVRGDRGVYNPVTGVARLLGNVRITRSENQLNGAEAIVNLRTNTARLVAAPGGRVQGLVVPQSGQGQAGQGTGSPRPAQPPTDQARPR